MGEGRGGETESARVCVMVREGQSANVSGGGGGREGEGGSDKTRSPTRNQKEA